MSSPQAPRQRRLLAPDAPERGPVEEIDGAGLACGHDPPVGEQGGSSGQVEIAGVVRRPRGRREVLQQGQRRRELEDRVAVVVGVGRRGDRAVAGADPDVSGGIDDRCRAAHPDGALALAGRRVDVELGGGTAGLGHGDHPAVVGPTVAVVAAVAEDDSSAVERQARALQQRGGGGAGRVDVLGQLGLARRRVEPDQLVRRVPADDLVGDDEELRARRVDHRGAGDADAGGDVAARE